MPNPTTVTYFGIPGYLILWFFALVSFYLFGRRVWYYLRILRQARPENRWDQPRQRLQLVFTYVLGQRKLFDEPVIGVAHFFIFWAFVFYAFGFFWSLLKGLFPFMPVPYADDVPWMAFALEVLGGLALAALIGAAVRRYIFTPPRLERSRDATLILGLIALVLLSLLSGQALKALGEGHASSWSPVGTLLGRIFAALGVAKSSAPTLYLWAWWLHMVTVLGFLAYLPYSKHLHLLAAPFSVFFASLHRGVVPVASEGAARLEQFTWRQLLNALACAECGRCDRVCPAFKSGFTLSPKMMVHHIKELLRTHTPGPPGETKFVGDMVKPEELWACTACYACMERCPVFNEHVPLIVEMRRALVVQGEVDQRLQEALTNLTRYGNSFGLSERARARWTHGLDFKIKDARKEPVEYLWFVGDYASYDARVQEITRAAARVFHAARLDFGILYEGERNAGNDVRRVGEEGLFEMLMEKNLAALSQAQFHQIVTTDPHTYHVLKNEYRWSDGNAKVLHHTELLDSLIQSGKLPLQRKLDLTVTYHDPCYLGRCNGVYAAPRRVLSALGAKILEMPRSFRNSYCCGAGGGRIWMEEPPKLQERPSESRVREAVALKDAQYLVVACPKDVVMFSDAIKTTGNEERIAVKEIIELVAEAL
jgi:Fe-S oxidoreductase